MKINSQSGFDENPKTRFLDMKKLQKAAKILKLPPKKILCDLI